MANKLMTQVKKIVISNQDLAEIHAEYVKAFKKIEKISAETINKIIVAQDKKMLEKIRAELKK